MKVRVTDNASVIIVYCGRSQGEVGSKVVPGYVWSSHLYPFFVFILVMGCRLQEWSGRVNNGSWSQGERQVARVTTRGER